MVQKANIAEDERKQEFIAREKLTTEKLSQNAEEMGRFLKESIVKNEHRVAKLEKKMDVVEKGSRSINQLQLEIAEFRKLLTQSTEENDVKQAEIIRKMKDGSARVANLETKAAKNTADMVKQEEKMVLKDTERKEDVAELRKLLMDSNVNASMEKAELKRDIETLLSRRVSHFEKELAEKESKHVLHDREKTESIRALHLGVEEVKRLYGVSTEEVAKVTKDQAVIERKVVEDSHRIALLEKAARDKVIRVMQEQAMSHNKMEEVSKG